MRIRPTLERDIQWLPDVERSAAQAFAARPALAWLAQGDVMDCKAHREFVDAGGSWVVEDLDGRILGFACARLEDQALHLHEISVRREAQGQGVGRKLLQQVVDAARHTGARELTLTTFADVPWNAPFYAQLGFEVIGEGLLDARLQQILADELAHGLEGRCAMRLGVDN
ncbi:GNAT family N-acetyltransferase [Pseudomonas asiatica]|uniref:GNAT family N-acetyltransferase n=1 Tax=Pseudomonas asiatica TaxID=2219225 RepID=UPI000C23530A|nr:MULTISPECIES: GNAT family N-acetyltransferase [Pseudomonas]CAB5587636.1 N-acetylglutamate synthase [Pseudomonas putida]MBO2921261.1 GNAT family N-acetyltransferase [Pseudomonas asiatica]PJI72079.1 N-acetyltransferase [Pseudomonas sp. MR 02]WPU58842.1 GNAT family N-acetyltransferase [Pseudomonas asiatica]CAB5619950.1 N-acetylglutamate synthase [Pseudomonas putida]